MRALASNVRGIVMAGAGHWLVEEQPAALAQALTSFLGPEVE